MREWLDEFYGSPETRAALEDSFTPIVTDLGTSVAAIAGSEVGISEPAVGAFIQAMVSNYVENYLSSSRAQLTDLLDSPDPKAAIQQRVGEWLEKRPGKVADEATYKTANAVTQTVYKDAGVTRKKWNATGKSCPYCQRMDGKVVGIERPFHREGDIIEVPDAEIAALKAKLNFTHEIGHPPQHAGCDCVIEPDQTSDSRVPLNEESMAKVEALQQEHFDKNYQPWAEYRKDFDELDVLPSRAEFNDLLTKNAKAVVGSSDVRIRTGSSTLSTILEDGRFKTQFETGTSGGNLNTKVRTEVEKFYFGIDPKATDRPIYGYLGGTGDLKRVSQYGDVVVQLKDDVRSRSTVTFYDSLDAYKTNEAIGVDGPSLFPRPLDNPDWRAWKPWDSDQAYGDATNITSARSVPGYPEVQIHGGVSVGDIDEVIFTRYQPTPELIASLEQAGISWRYDSEFVKIGF